jgi:pheromone receptor transcription factor
MATEITDHDSHVSPAHDDQGVGNGNGALGSTDAARGVKRQRPSTADDDDDDLDDKTGRERRKIEIKFIQDKSRRHITFSKRKAGIMKKVRAALSFSFISRRRLACCAACSLVPQAYELSVLTGTQVLLLVVSETGLVYTFTTPKLQPLVTKSEGKNLIQVRSIFSFCLRSPNHFRLA